MTVDEDLTDDELDRICHPLVQNAAKVRYLESLGLTVKRKPSGRPLVNRAHYRRVRGGDPEPAIAGAQEPAWSVHA
jgi:hypothetical protein